MVLMGAVAAAGFALGLVMVVLGIRGSPPRHASPRARSRQRDRHVIAKLAAAGIAGLVVLLVTGWPVAAGLTAMAAWFVPEAVVRRRAETDEVARTEAVAAWTEMLRDTLAAAAGLEEAIVASGRAAPESIRSDVERLSRRLDREPLAEALERFAEDLANPAADLVVAALITATRREARNLVPLLGALADSARAEAEMRRRIHTSRARVRTAARIVTATLLLFAGGLVILNPTYLEPYATPTGQFVLLGVGGIFAFGWWLLHRMARVEGPERFFGQVAASGGGWAS